MVTIIDDFGNEEEFDDVVQRITTLESQMLEVIDDIHVLIRKVEAIQNERG